MYIQMLRYGFLFIVLVRRLVVGAITVTEFMFLMLNVVSIDYIFDQICYIVSFNRYLFDDAM